MIALARNAANSLFFNFIELYFLNGVVSGDRKVASYQLWYQCAGALLYDVTVIRCLRSSERPSYKTMLLKATCQIVWTVFLE